MEINDGWDIVRVVNVPSNNKTLQYVYFLNNMYRGDCVWGLVLHKNVKNLCLLFPRTKAYLVDARSNWTDFAILDQYVIASKTRKPLYKK